jgi:hypothetical protein
MNCNTGKFTKKKIILLSLLGVGLTVGIYFVFSTTNNPAIAATVPALAAFAICPVMCAVMGGLMWMMNRSSKNKGKEQRHLLKDEEMSSCCSDTNVGHSANYKIQQQQELTANSGLFSKFNKDTTLDVTGDNGDNALLSSHNLEKQNSASRN